MGKIHFVYVKPPPRLRFRSRVPRALERAARKSWDTLLAPSYRFGGIPNGTVPMPAPGSITVNLYRYLRRDFTTWLYDFAEHGAIPLEEGDILLGHPHPDPETLVRQTFLEGKRCRCRALLFPLHHGIAAVNQYALGLMEQADVVFGIMGPYWYDTLDQSFLGKWKKKIVRLDLAVDPIHYPFVKRRFNAPGKRGYLYIGSNRPEKGTELLSRTFGLLGELPRGWIGPGPEIAGVERLASWAGLTPEYVSQLARRFDFFVNTSISDANPATILEAMAWGFLVACTPQSGYYRMPTLVKLSSTDPQANAEALLALQEAPEELLIELSRANRRLVETQYTWDHFCGAVWNGLAPYV